jgi:transcriptional regulator with XRE-family HTH domain
LTKGEYARRARERKYISIKELSFLSGVPKNTISRVEHDLVDPRLSTVELLAEALGVSIDEYIGYQIFPMRGGGMLGKRK